MSDFEAMGHRSTANRTATPPVGTDFRSGDMVRVTYEAEYRGRHADGTHEVKTGRRHRVLPEGATVELIERADDPSKDLVGTVRRGNPAVPVAKVGPDQWVSVWPGRPSSHVEVFPNGNVVGYRLIGAVPGTPAAEKQAADEEPRRHEFEPSYSGMVCGRMVMRDGGGDSCGQPADAPVHERKPEGYPFPLGTKVRGYRPSFNRWEIGYLLSPSGYESPGTVRVGKTPDDEYGNHLRISLLERVE